MACLASPFRLLAAILALSPRSRREKATEKVGGGSLATGGLAASSLVIARKNVADTHLRHYDISEQVKK